MLDSDQRIELPRVVESPASLNRIVVSATPPLLDPPVSPRARWFDRITAAASQFPIPALAPAEFRASRAQVLAAATVRLGREPLGVLAQGLNPSRFDSWMPGLRRKAYRYFPSTTDLVREVLMLAVNPERSEATDQLVGAMAAAADEAVCPLEAVRALPTAYIDRIRKDDIFRLELTAWIVMPEYSPLREQLNSLHESLVERSAAGLQILLESYDLELRDPLTWTELATMLLSVVRGTALSAEVKGDEYDPDVIVHTLMAIVIGATRPASSDNDDLQTTFQRQFAS